MPGGHSPRSTISGLSIGRIDGRHGRITLGRAGDWRQASTRARGTISGENDVKGIVCTCSRKGEE